MMHARPVTTGSLIEAGVLAIGDGYRAKNSELGDTGIPFARAQNLLSNGFNFEGADLFPEHSLSLAGDKVSRYGDCVLTSKGSVGRVGFVNSSTPRFVYSPQLSYWRSLATDVIHPQYLRYWLLGPEFSRQRDMVKGSTDMADYVNLRDQRRMQITLPPISAQLKIAALLSAYDDHIENNTRRIKVLEEMAQRTYREWFVDFRHPGHGDALLVDSELGPIPEGWRVARVKDLCHRVVDGDWIETKDQGGDAYRLLQVSNIGLGSFRETGNFRYISQETFERLRCTQIHVGFVLVSRMPEPIGRAWFVDHLDIPAVTAVDVAILEPNTDVSSSRFLAFSLNTDRSLANAAARASGTTRARITRRDLETFPILLPASPVLHRFSEFLDAVGELQLSLTLHNRRLQQARGLLLPRLMSGKIDVEHLNVRVEEAAA